MLLRGGALVIVSTIPKSIPTIARSPLLEIKNVFFGAVLMEMFLTFSTEVKKKNFDHFMRHRPRTLILILWTVTYTDNYFKD